MKKIKYVPMKREEKAKGKWLWSFADNGWADHKCSHCGYTINTDIHVKVDYPYCPNCGARMENGVKRLRYEVDSWF